MSSLKLLHSGGNGVIISAPSSNPAANRTITVPGNADGEILTTTNPKTGNILQVVNTRVTATSSLAASSDFSAVITSLNTSITPSSTSSKILVTMYMMGEGDDNDSNYRCRVTRDISGGTSGTRLGGLDAGNRNGVFQLPTEGHDSGNTLVTMTYVQFANYLDSPSTTSACTYKLIIQNASSQTWYVNRTKRDQDLANDERGHSYVTLMEVAG